MKAAAAVAMRAFSSSDSVSQKKRVTASSMPSWSAMTRKSVVVPMRSMTP